jgi:hypothetical protein
MVHRSEESHPVVVGVVQRDRAGSAHERGATLNLGGFLKEIEILADSRRSRKVREDRQPLSKLTEDISRRMVRPTACVEGRNVRRFGTMDHEPTG